MYNSIIFKVIFFTCIGTGIMAGLFFSFSTFIMEALGNISPESGINAMKSINRTILNPLFGVIFFGTALTDAISINRSAIQLRMEWQNLYYIR